MIRSKHPPNVYNTAIIVLLMYYYVSGFIETGIETSRSFGQLRFWCLSCLLACLVCVLVLSACYLLNYILRRFDVKPQKQHKSIQGIGNKTYPY